MNAVLIVLAAGLGTGLSLIVAIGGQNAFVLRQGIRRDAVLPIVAICTASDAVLMTLGITGVGAVVKSWPTAVTIVGWVGGGFLLCYAVLAAHRAVRPAQPAVSADPQRSARSAVLTCLALTWLNPHVYLDTVLLVGSIANSYGAQRWLFGIGAVMSSALWFVALGFGARLLSGFFAKAASWRMLDALIAVTMTTLGVSMVVRL